jgi:hypothetical protein
MTRRRTRPARAITASRLKLVNVVASGAAAAAPRRVVNVEYPRISQIRKAWTSLDAGMGLCPESRFVRLAPFMIAVGVRPVSGYAPARAPGRPRVKFQGDRRLEAPDGTGGRRLRTDAIRSRRIPAHDVLGQCVLERPSLLDQEPSVVQFWQ